MLTFRDGQINQAKLSYWITINTQISSSYLICTVFLCWSAITNLFRNIQHTGTKLK